ncbi:putative GTP-binding protein ypt2 [Blattamonas nauphoetae]|uniref:GTP-binding protein ypt2 n=1 Tax=Blattamonas nauphoetae TaxID=2049346 RepID=A0ABQ9YA50_9EUKA|nr:putative GTP-binding protein ypt2 [Blattamonas nauphoetae]
MTQDFFIKVVLIGDYIVGKTSTGNFTDTTTSTIGVNNGIKTIQIDGQTIKLQLLDTSGNETFRRITTQYFRDTKGVILMYNITRRSSFESLSRWFELIKQHSNEDTIKLLIGNKCDLEARRQVATEEGKKCELSPRRTPPPEPVPSPEPVPREPQLSWWNRRWTRRQTENSQATRPPPHLATQSHDAPRSLSFAVPSDASSSTEPQTEHTHLQPPQRKKGSEISVPDNYTLIRPIKSGGFGTVVEMEDKRTKERVAGKMIQCLTDKQSERIAREVGRLKRYRHAGIVSFQKMEEMENMGVIVMELGERSVGDLVKECKARDSLVPREVCAFCVSFLC